MTRERGWKTTRAIFRLLVMGMALTVASVPMHADPCATLAASPTSIRFNAGGANGTGGLASTFTVTADPACEWFFKFVSGNFAFTAANYSLDLGPNQFFGTVTFTPTSTAVSLYAGVNHLTTTLTAQFVVASYAGGTNDTSATITATQDAGLNLAFPCPIQPGPYGRPLCTGNVGVPFFLQPLASGGMPPYTYSSTLGAPPTNLPLGLTNIGLSLNFSTGLISGTPTAAYGGGCCVGIYVTDSDGGITSNAFVLNISGSNCADLINNALDTSRSGANICATFTPNQSNTLAEAAQVCGFKDFDWIQNIIVQFDPSQFYARNVDGGFDGTINGPVRLTSKRVPWSDPPQGGGYAPHFGGGANPDNSYPFYYNPNTEVANHETGTVPANCALIASAGDTLTFHDAPADFCLPGGAQNGLPMCQDPVLAPGATAEPKGSFGGYFTHLVGVNNDGTATDLGIGFTWTSNYNGTTGGASIKKTDLPADGNGTGGVTIISVNETTTYGTNTPPPGPPPPLASGNACDGVFGGTFNGDVIISAGQNCTFTFGQITGNVREDGGNLSLSAVLIGGSAQINDGTFSIGPATSIGGDLQIQNIPAGAAQNQVCGSTVFGNLQFHNNGTPVQIGSSSPSCAGNQIGGNLEVHNNDASTAIFNNTVTGNLDDHNNTAPTQVFSNTITGNLQCVNNSSITGGGNTAQQKQGQCSEF